MKFIAQAHLLVLLLLCISVSGYAQLNLDFSQKRGFYDTGFQLEIVCEDPNATIRYTTDNSKPSTTTGTIYSSPISITGTTAVRVIAYTGIDQSEVKTHTYIFLSEIINAPYMENNITNDAVYGSQMEASLLDLPAVSIISDSIVTQTNISTEMEISAEMFYADGTSEFQINCGVQTSGGAASTVNPKKNYRLEFKGIYGDTKLEANIFDDGYKYGVPPVNKFDQLLLRGGSQDALNGGFGEEAHAQYVRN